MFKEATIRGFFHRLESNGWFGTEKTASEKIAAGAYEEGFALGEQGVPLGALQGPSSVSRKIYQGLMGGTILSAIGGGIGVQADAPKGTPIHQRALLGTAVGATMAPFGAAAGAGLGALAGVGDMAEFRRGYAEGIRARQKSGQELKKEAEALFEGI